MMIEEKRHEILSIMLGLLSNSESYGDLTNGYLNVKAHLQNSFTDWIKTTFNDPIVYCGMFFYHAAAWPSSDRMAEVHKLILHYHPDLKDTTTSDICRPQGGE